MPACSGRVGGHPVVATSPGSRSMSFVAACSCGESFEVRDELYGQLVFCPKCGRRFLARERVRTPGGDTPTISAKAEQQVSIQVTCRCGKRLNFREKYFGRRVICPVCGAPVQVPKR